MKKPRKIRDVINPDKFKILVEDYKREYLRTTGYEFTGELTYANGFITGFGIPMRVKTIRDRLDSLKKLDNAKPSSEFENEIWVKIDGFSRAYSISNYGRVISIAGHGLLKLKKATKRPDGYYRMALGRKYGSLLHTLVARAFCPNPENKPCVNHKNFDKSDNRAVNLEWVTYKENSDHASVIRIRNNKLKKLKIAPPQDDKVNGLLLAMEFGYKQCEKGNNLDLAFINFNKLITQ